VLAIDTSVIVAGLVSWHTGHQLALDALNTALESSRVVLPTRVLIEAYSVMTRLPAPHRLAPADALAALASTFAGGVTLKHLPVSSYWRFLKDIAGDGTTGGSVYDAEIIECAIRAGASSIVTLNLSDFERLADGRLRVLDPRMLIEGANT